jgi:U3 small nucleolar RNA-associated protein 20
MRICQTLKSWSRDVRDVARSTLVKVVCSLGPSYISVIVSELRHLLSKGYQVHVMAHTVHSIVTAMSGSLLAGEFDACLKDVVEV